MTRTPSSRPLFRTRPRAALAVGLGAALALTLVGPAAIARPQSAQAAGPACTDPAWSSSAVYTGGQKVTYGSHAWTAKWWTSNDVPGKGGASVWDDRGACTTGTPQPTEPPTPQPPTPQPPAPTPPAAQPPAPQPPAAGSGDDKVVGYYTQWSTYTRNFQVKDVNTTGAASKMTHMLYAFGNVTNGKCSIGDSYADYDKAFTADQAVDGVADSWSSTDVRGNIGQMRKLKKANPKLKILWSMGGWTWSGGFGQAAKDPAAFAKSCHDMVEDPRWADVFDGIDIDWEYPNTCGLTCDTSGRDGYVKLMAALRAEFGKDLVTSAITADGTPGGKIDAADYGAAAKYVDFYMPMTYDYFGAFNPQGPTAPHSALTSYAGMPTQGFDAATAIANLKKAGVPAKKLLLGIGFYGRGWTGVTQAAPGGTATGPAPGPVEPGIADYRVLKNTCPATSTVGGTAYALCGNDWWSYDTPATIKDKQDWRKQQGLGGTFVWELGGDTADGELMKAIVGR